MSSVREKGLSRTFEQAIAALQQRIAALEHELIERNHVEVELRDAYDHLSQRIQERTKELQQVNTALCSEIVKHRKKAEALRLSEERFRTVADFTYDWEYWIDPDGNYLYVSPSCERITGYRPDEFLADARLLERIIHTDDRARFVAHRHCETGEQEHVFSIRFRILTRSHEMRWICHICQPVYANDGRWLGTRVSNRDITERQEAEEQLRQSQQLLKRTFATLRDAVLTIDADTHILTCNPAASEMFGYTWHEMIGRPISHFLTDINAWQALIKHLFRAIQEPGYLFLPECQMKRKDGIIFTTEHSILPLPDEYGRYVGWVSVVRDISDRKRAAEQLRQTNEQLVQRVNELRQRNREVTLLNEMANLLQRCRTVEEAGRVIALIAPKLFVGHSGALYIHNQTHSRLEATARWGRVSPPVSVFACGICHALQQKRTYITTTGQHEMLCCYSTNQQQPAPAMCVPLIAQGTTVGILHLCDGPVTDQQTYQRWKQLAEMIAGHVALALSNLRLREQLQYQAIRDPLTGLFNRRYLDETLKRELQRALRCQHRVGIIMLDIDHFKHFNDTYGHDAGDAVLRAMGTLLQASIRGDDIACRYGGEEFTLVLPGASLAGAKQRAEQLRSTVKSMTLQHNGTTLEHITISLGVACFPQHGSSDEAMVKVADKALYHAKAAGRDCVIVATTDA